MQETSGSLPGVVSVSINPVGYHVNKQTKFNRSRPGHGSGKATQSHRQLPEYSHEEEYANVFCR